jgi:hypothetical protein
MRIIITGGPHTGKTTLAARLAAQIKGPVRHTDDLIDSGRSLDEQAADADRWLALPGPWVIEGVTAAWLLRAWCRAHPRGRPPVDRVIVLSRPLTPLTDGQTRMAKGTQTVMAEVVARLKLAGVPVT